MFSLLPSSLRLPSSATSFFPPSQYFHVFSSPLLLPLSFLSSHFFSHLRWRSLQSPRSWGTCSLRWISVCSLVPLLQSPNVIFLSYPYYLLSFFLFISLSLSFSRFDIHPSSKEGDRIYANRNQVHVQAFQASNYAYRKLSARSPGSRN